MEPLNYQILLIIPAEDAGVKPLLPRLASLRTLKLPVNYSSI